MGAHHTKTRCPSKDCARFLANLAERADAGGAWRTYRTPDGERVMRCPDHGAFLVADDGTIRRVTKGTVLA